MGVVPRGMDRLDLKTPLDFIASRIGLPTWHEVAFGLDNHLLDPKASYGLALAAFENENPPDALIGLVISYDAGAPDLSPVRTLADLEPPQDEAEVADRWLYLVLAWLHEHRASLRDPLDAVEEVYAAFGYPRKVAKLVRYMPSDRPKFADRGRNEKALIEDWGRFLQEERARLVRT